MYGSMVDIQSATVEIRRGKKDERKKKGDKNIISASATQGGHNNSSFWSLWPSSPSLMSKTFSNTKQLDGPYKTIPTVQISSVVSTMLVVANVRKRRRAQSLEMFVCTYLTAAVYRPTKISWNVAKNFLENLVSDRITDYPCRSALGRIHTSATAECVTYLQSEIETKSSLTGNVQHSSTFIATNW